VHVRKTTLTTLSFTTFHQTRLPLPQRMLLLEALKNQWCTSFCQLVQKQLNKLKTIKMPMKDWWRALTSVLEATNLFQEPMIIQTDPSQRTEDHHVKLIMAMKVWQGGTVNSFETPARKGTPDAPVSEIDMTTSWHHRGCGVATRLRFLIQCRKMTHLSGCDSHRWHKTTVQWIKKVNGSSSSLWGCFCHAVDRSTYTPWLDRVQPRQYRIGWLDILACFAGWLDSLISLFSLTTNQTCWTLLSRTTKQTFSPKQ